jgi:hypothetical protein
MNGGRTSALAALLLLAFLWASCTPRSTPPNPAQSNATPAAPSGVASTWTPTSRASPTLTLAETQVVITPTVKPDLPCNGIMPERVYLFMDCSDIRRIRENLKARDPQLLETWKTDKQIVDTYLSAFPTTYDPNNSANVLWWGDGNYVAEDMALIYLVSGDDVYAEGARRLLDLIRNNTHYGTHLGNYSDDATGGLLAGPNHGNMPFSSLVFSYLSIRDTDLFTDPERQQFDDFFVQQGYLAYEAIGRRGGRIPLDSWINRNVPHAAAIIATTIAVAFPNHPRSQELYDMARPELDWQITNWWHPDGGWGEDTENYGFGRLEGLLILAEALKKNMNIDMYQVDYGGKTLGTLCRHYVDVLTPEGMSPALNDTNHYYVDPGFLRLCAYRTNDSQLAFAADEYRWGWEHAYGRDFLDQDTMLGEIAWWGLSPKPQEPTFTSLASPTTGYAVLRSDWHHTASYLLLQFTASKVHAEQSFGAIYLYDGGPWMVGNGYHLPSFVGGQEGQSTWQHSTLAMDGASQTQTDGTLLDFADLDQTGLISVEGHPYPNTAHTRTVAWIKAWHQWLVWDDFNIFDSKSHSLQLRWYVRGDWAHESDNIWTFSRSSGDPGFLTVAMYPAGQAAYKQVERHYYVEQWVSDAVGVELDATAIKPLTRLISALTSAEKIPTTNRVDEEKGTLLRSVLDQTTWEWLVPSKSGEVAIGSYSLDGIAGCLHLLDNQIQGYCLFHGAHLAKDTQELVKASGPLDVEVDLQNSSINIDVASETDVAFYWPTQIGGIKNGTSQVPFQQQQSFVQLTLTAGKYILTVQ